ncbi:hypothetical protein [Streptomyces sp. URMC 124]
MGAAARPEVDLAAFYDHQDDAVDAIMRVYAPSPRRGGRGSGRSCT